MRVFSRILLYVKRVQPDYAGSRADELLLLLGEELKHSLVAITQLAELTGKQHDDISLQAKKGLKTIDNILLYQQAHSGQLTLELEPVHIGSSMHSVASNMASVMKASGCVAELQIQHGLQPVDTDRRLLEGALTSLWHVFISTVEGPAEVVCKARRTGQGVRVSIHSAQANFENVSLSKINLESAQPVNGLAGPAVDLITSQGLFSLLGSQLNKAAFKNAVGFGVTLPISKQLQMV